MTPEPLISVCIPVFNCEDYIEIAIKSVLKQTYSRFELVILDNASTDRTLQIAGRFKDSRIRILQSDVNRGFAYNWNRCLTEAQGEFVKILPADDLIAPDCLEIQVHELIENSDLAVVCSARSIIDLEGKVIGTRGMGKKRITFDFAEATRIAIRRGTNPFGEPGAVLFRSNAMRIAGQFNTTHFYVVDLDFWLKLLQSGQLRYLPEKLASFRISPISASTVVKSSQAQDTENWMKKIAAENPGLVGASDLKKGIRSARIAQFARSIFYFLTFGVGKGKFNSLQFLRFIGAGLINTAVSYVLFSGFVWFGLYYVWAAILSSFASLIFNFSTISLMVFRERNPRKLFKFTIVYTFSIAMNIAGIHFVSGVLVNTYLSAAIVAGPVAILSYVFYSRFVFR